MRTIIPQRLYNIIKSGTDLDHWGVFIKYVIKRTDRLMSFSRGLNEEEEEITGDM